MTDMIDLLKFEKLENVLIDTVHELNTWITDQCQIRDIIGIYKIEYNPISRLIRVFGDGLLMFKGVYTMVGLIEPVMVDGDPNVGGEHFPVPVHENSAFDIMTFKGYIMGMVDKSDLSYKIKGIEVPVHD